jgi:aminopeptidase N
MRVLYADADFDRHAARFKDLPAADQLGTLQDYWAFGRAGYAPLSAYFEMAQGASANVDPYVAMQIASALEELWRMQAGRPEQAQTARFARAIVRPMFDAIGWDAKAGEPPNASLARDELIRTLGRLGDADIAAEARRRVESDDPALLPGDIRQAAIVAYAAQAAPAQYETLLARARAERDFVVRRQLFFALAEAQDPALADRTLEAARSDAAVGQLKTQLIWRVARTHPRRTWDFIMAHRAELEAPLDRSAQLEFAANVASFGADPALARAVDAYAETLPVASRQEAVKAAAEIRARARIVEELAPASASWLAAHASSP